jgi:hypothetical protein
LKDIAYQELSEFGNGLPDQVSNVKMISNFLLLGNVQES